MERQSSVSLPIRFSRQVFSAWLASLKADFFGWSVSFSYPCSLLLKASHSEPIICNSTCSKRDLSGGKLKTSKKCFIHLPHTPFPLTLSRPLKHYHILLLSPCCHKCLPFRTAAASSSSCYAVVYQSCQLYMTLHSDQLEKNQISCNRKNIIHHYPRVQIQY